MLWGGSDNWRNRRVGRDARRRLSGQLDAEFVEQHLGVDIGLSISRQNEPTAVDGGNTNIDHLNGGEFFP